MRGQEVAPLLDATRSRLEMADRYVESYRRYCWPVHSQADLKIAPFHLLAAEGQVFCDKDHVWHMDTLAKICSAGPDLLLATPYLTVDLTDPRKRSPRHRLVGRDDRSVEAKAWS